jgi:hypothetical protein
MTTEPSPRRTDGVFVQAEDHPVDRGLLRHRPQRGHAARVDLQVVDAARLGGQIAQWSSTSLTWVRAAAGPRPRSGTWSGSVLGARLVTVMEVLLVAEGKPSLYVAGKLSLI